MKPNILHWPSSYPDTTRNQDHNAIFVQEHIKATSPLVNNRVLFISPDSVIGNRKWHTRTDTIESGIPTTRFYFNRKLHLGVLNIYIRFIIFIYFLELIIFKRFYPKIVHLHFFQSGEWAMLFARIFRIKTIVTEHWTALIGYPIISQERFYKAKRVYEFASRVLPVSTHLGNGILANTKAHIAGRMQVVHNCVDTGLFVPNRHPNEMTGYNLITVSRLDEQKDIPTLLKSLSMVKTELPKIQLSIIGSGNPEPFKKMSLELGIENNVEFLGSQPKSVIANKMAQSNLFVLSSISENSPCVIGEAHCCGLAVVATDVGGVKELVIEGAVVPHSRPDLLAQQIIHHLHKKIDKEKLVQTARSKFSYDAIGHEIFNVYKKVCAE